MASAAVYQDAGAVFLDARQPLDRRTHALADAPFDRRIGVFYDADTGALRSAGSELPLRYYMVLKAFNTRYHLNRMLKVEVAQGEEPSIVTVFAPALDVGGTGSDFESALNDLGETAVMLLEECVKTPIEQCHESMLETRGRIEKYINLLHHD